MDIIGMILFTPILGLLLLFCRSKIIKANPRFADFLLIIASLLISVGLLASLFVIFLFYAF